MVLEHYRKGEMTWVLLSFKVDKKRKNEAQSNIYLNEFKRWTVNVYTRVGIYRMTKKCDKKDCPCGEE